MSVEEEFHLEIPNAAAARMTTVGDMHSFLVAELKRLGRTEVDADQVFARLREIVCAQLGVKPELVVPEASFVADLGAD